MRTAYPGWGSLNRAGGDDAATSTEPRSAFRQSALQLGDLLLEPRNARLESSC